jgi:hypothetical protein
VRYIVMLVISLLGLFYAIIVMFTSKRKRSQGIFIYSILCCLLWFLKVAGFDNFANRNMYKTEFIDSYEFTRGVSNNFINMNIIFAY